MKNKESKKKTMIIIFVVIIIILIIALIIATQNNNNERNMSEFNGNYSGGERKDRGEARIEERVEISGQEDISDKKTIENKTFSSSKNDETIISTSENGELTLSNAQFTKKGDTSDLRNSDYLGLNSAILAKTNSSMNLSSLNVETLGKGSSGIVANGNNASIKVTGTTIETSGERSRGLLATEGARIEATDMTITTNGYKASAVATDTGGGTITLKNSIIKTDNKDSVGVYSTGNIIVSDTEITTYGSEAIVIDGYNVADFTNCTVTAHKKRGVAIYYTGPAEQQRTKGLFKMRNSTLTVYEGPAFYVTNTDGDIYLKNVKLNISSGVLLNVCVDTQGDLGQEKPVENPTGGEVKITGVDQTLTGNIIADKESSVELVLENSTYTGTINAENTAQKIVVNLDSSSVWNLTGDCYITELNAEEGATINTNGHKINYVKN